jgi:uncharacterized membrane protein YkvA (DUF1232 family)
MRLRRVAVARVLWRVGREGRRPGAPGIADRLRAVPRLVSMTWRGHYAGLGRRRLALLLLAVLYLVSPLDLIPDVVPLLGVTDDAVVLTWLAGTLLSETALFLAWEASRTRARVVPGELAAP